MKEILFRGQNPFTKEWHEGLLAHNMDNDNGLYEGWYISNSFGRPYAYRVDPETVGQYTGLNDHAGTKIFNGDIVMIDGDTDEIGVVEWDEDELKYYIDSEGCLLEYSLGEFYSKELEVIGNIHDNPELLEA